ncbi:MAG: hypothetical protein ACREU2_18940 [Steroidobacteraceae bacterium]
MTAQGCCQSGLRRGALYRRGAPGAGALLLIALTSMPLLAQQPPPKAAGAAGHAAVPTASARARAPFDPSGYWVSLITQNWRYRMVVPARGDYAGIPINARAKQFADAWSATADIAAGKQCEAYGAPGIMQIPERLQISWQDDDTLRVDTDAGRQVRLLHFKHDPSAEKPAPTLQGYSAARWQLFMLSNSFGAVDEASKGRRYGSLVVNTDDLLPGLLRKNGVPYGADTKMSEYWKLFGLGADQWLTISTSVDDPEYLSGPYVYDSIFQREAGASQRDPSPCSLMS